MFPVGQPCHRSCFLSAVSAGLTGVPVVEAQPDDGDIALVPVFL